MTTAKVKRGRGVGRPRKGTDVNLERLISQALLDMPEAQDDPMNVPASVAKIWVALPIESRPSRSTIYRTIKQMEASGKLPFTHSGRRRDPMHFDVRNLTAPTVRVQRPVPLDGDMPEVKRLMEFMERFRAVVDERDTWRERCARAENEVTRLRNLIRQLPLSEQAV